MRKAGAALALAPLAPLALLVLLAGVAGAQERTDDPLRAAELRRLVWAAADAPEAGFEAALAELDGFPGTGWREVHDVLEAGRDYVALHASRPATWQPVGIEEFARHAQHFEGFPWEAGVVRRYEIGEDDLPFWYAVDLPDGYDGSAAVPVVLDFHVLGAPVRPGWAVVRLNPNIGAAPKLGGAPISMTAGVAAQSIVLSVIADLERRFHVDRDRVFVTGYSRFGNAAWYWGAHWPDLWAGVLPASGYYAIPDALLGNFRNVAVLAAYGDDRGHRDSNRHTRTLGRKLARAGFDAALHASPGRAVGPEYRAAAWEWMADRRRDPLPERVTYARHDPNHPGAYWVEIEEVEETGGDHTVVIGSPADPDAERIHLDRRAASVDVRLAGENEIVVTARNVARLRLRLSPTLVDLTRPVTIRSGARTVRHDPAPTIRTLLVNFRRDRDPRRLFPDEVAFAP